MNIKRFFIATCLILSALCHTTAQSYQQLWKEAEALEKKDLPKSIIEKLQHIYKKAETEKNTPQMMKAYLAAMTQRNAISPDSFYVDIKKLEEWVASSETSASDAAVLHSLLGEIYSKASVRGAYKQEITTEHKEHMSEWDRLTYQQKSFSHYSMSLSDLEVLDVLTANNYLPLVQLGEWSKFYNHSLMHLIGKRAIEGIINQQYILGNFYSQSQWDFPLKEEEFMQSSLFGISSYDCPATAMQVFHRLLKQYKEKNRRDAWLLTELERLKTITSNYDIKADSIFPIIENLREKFSDRDICAEVYKFQGETYTRHTSKRSKELQLIREAIAKYPRYARINEFKNTEQEILNPSLRISTPISSYPEEEEKMTVYHCNLSSFTLKFYKINLPADSVSERNKWDSKWLSKHSVYHSQQEFKLKPHNEYIITDTTLTFKVPSSGIYLIETVANGKASSRSLFQSTPLHLLQLHLPNDSLQLVVLDGKSGHPVPYANIHMGVLTPEGKVQLKQQLKTNNEGTVTIKKDSERCYYRATTTQENSMLYETFGYSRYSSETKQNKEQERNHVFTDRAIYRPGQTVHVKGIVYNQLEDIYNVIPDKECTLSLEDVNGKKISQLKVKTNKFGSFTAEFVLPTDGLTGTFIILLDRDGWAPIQVEEYKRPTFEVAFSPITSPYAMGDSVILKGEARTYSGAPLALSKVNYRIDCITEIMLLRWGVPQARNQVLSGEIETDENGCFNIPVYIEPQKEVDKCFWWKVSYNISADVTAFTGETQATKTRLHLSSIPLKLHITGGNTYMPKESPQSLKIECFNLSNEVIETEVTYKVYKVQSKLQEVRFKPKETGELVLQGTIASNKSFIPEDIYNLPSGAYRLVTTAGLPGYVNTAEAYHDFVLFSLNDKRVPTQDTDWFYKPESRFSIDKPSIVQFGTSEQNVYVFYDIFTEERRIESRRFILSDSLITFKYDYKPEYGKGIYVSVLFVKNGKTYSHNTTINKPEANKKLSLKWETFRDKLRPGQQEEWRLSVLTPDGKPANAEMIAAMYDASLDQITPSKTASIRKQPISLNTPYMSNRRKWEYRNTYSTIQMYTDFSFLRKKVPFWSYDNFYSQLTSIGYYQKQLLRGMQKTESRVVNDDMVEMDEIQFMEATAADQLSAGTSMRIAGLGDNGNTQEDDAKAEYLPEGMKLRENFNETAFFLPQLRTDSLGQVSIAFTLPESLTRWHFMALAHTATMENGFIEDFVTASKEFMVQPNLPRFIRASDATTIATALINLTEKEIKGTARMELFNPSTEKVLVTRKQSFTIEAGKTETIEFDFTVKDASVPLLACRIVADCGDYSDGEQRYLPVLTDKVWITETLPLSVNGAETVQKPLDKLFNNNSRTAIERRMTIEFTGNPAWLAIQALPAVAAPTDENALSWVAAYYAHTLATHIIQSQPRIKAVFDSWRTQGVNRETLWSNLQKNQELKTILLEETPWLTDATDEAEQKNRLAILFDLTVSEGKATLYLNKLTELQNEEGAWGWYKGMNSSRYITTYIVVMIERIKVLTGTTTEEAEKMLKKAIIYLNKQLNEEYKNILHAEKEGNKQIRPSEIALQYIYALTINNNNVPDEIRSSSNYMINKLPDLSTDFTIHGKALAAIILKRTNRTEQAEAFIKSLLEYTVYTPELGRYFDTQAAYYSWRDYRIPTQVAVMEALTYVTPENTSALEEMKQWLLKQKQTQSWDTPVNTVDAIYALLMQGADLLTEKKPVQLLLDKRPVTSAEAPIPGMDYIKRTYTGEDLKTFPKQITVKKEDAGIAWGAVYAQYLEDMEKTSSSKRLAESNSELHAQPISVERRVLIERIVDGKAVWEPATEATEWKVGNKIMSRLVITCDRDMDFVQLKDTRAACTEPIDVLSGYRYDGNVGYYMSIKDASTSFFFDRLRKGVYTIDNVMRIDRKGTYQMGIATMQSAYAPEFTANTTSSKVVVK